MTIRNSQHRQSSLSEVAMQRGLYNLLVDAGYQSDVMETFMAHIEEKCSTPYKRLCSGKFDIEGEGWDRLLVSRLIALQVIRTPKYRKRVREMLEDMVDFERQFASGLQPSGEASGKKAGLHLPETHMGNKQNITQYAFNYEPLSTIERAIFTFNWKVLTFSNARLCIGDNGVCYGDGNAFGNYGFYIMPLTPNKLWTACAANKQY